MKDMNIAKLTSQDLPLFNGIVSDLFPGVETPTIDYGKVRSTSHLQWFSFECQKVISFALIRHTIGLKTRATFSSNQKLNQDQSRLVRTRFPALFVSYVYMLKF